MDDTKDIISKLRKILELLGEDEFITTDELSQVKSKAAEYYLAHTNREITLSKDEFQVLVDVLKYKQN